MASALIYLVAIFAVAAVVYLLASMVFGRGEELEALPPGSTPTRLPPRGVEGADVRALRFQQTVRGYKVTEVDWALERLASELDDLRGQVAVLQRQLDAATGGHAPAEGATTGQHGDTGAEVRDRAGDEHAGDTGEHDERSEDTDG